VYCCRTRAPLDWTALLERSLGARRVRVTDVLRGGAEPAAAAAAGRGRTR
jgi:hypothetical protein